MFINILERNDNMIIYRVIFEKYRNDRIYVVTKDLDDVWKDGYVQNPNISYLYSHKKWSGDK